MSHHRLLEALTRQRPVFASMPDWRRRCDNGTFLRHIGGRNQVASAASGSEMCLGHVTFTEAYIVCSGSGFN